VPDLGVGLEGPLYLRPHASSSSSRGFGAETEFLWWTAGGSLMGAGVDSISTKKPPKEVFILKAECAIWVFVCQSTSWVQEVCDVDPNS